MRSHGALFRFLMIVCLLILTTSLSAQQQQVKRPTSHTQIVLLGTGNPPADPDRSGPATAIVVDGTPYLVDFGAGVVRRAKAAVADRGITALEPSNLRVVFVTHLHSDHTVGYPDLILTPWLLGRRVPLEVYGPAGIKAMTEHIFEAYRADFETRSQHYREKLSLASTPEGHKVNAHEITAGVVYKDANVTVTAFPTKHAMESYGYRFDTPDRSIVISGDTNPTHATIDACHGCDILIHEVLTQEWPADSLPRFDCMATRRRQPAVETGRVAERNDDALFGTCGRRTRPGRLLSHSTKIEVA